MQVKKLALRVELQTIKSSAKIKHNAGSHKKSKNNSKQGTPTGNQDKFKNKIKRDYFWQLVKPKGKEPSKLTKYGKIYYWWSEESGASSRKGCDK